LRSVIESDGLIDIVGEAESGDVALAEIERLMPDIAVLDVNMPVADGLAIARELQRRILPTVAIFLTMHADEAIFNAALDADVKGFVIKDSAASDIVTAIRLVKNGKDFFSRELSGFVENRRKGKRSPVEDLTTAERRVLRLIADSKSTKQIADELFISTRTVDHHRANIAAKLNLSGKNALFNFAINNKIVL